MYEIQYQEYGRNIKEFATAAKLTPVTKISLKYENKYIFREAKH